MRIPYYHVDAFASRPFSGNPAGVCPLPEWLPDATLQQIAAENRHSETAFFVGEGGVYDLRWFTPTVEVDLCGHATLAAAHVIFRHLGYAGERIRFRSQSGDLTVSQRGDLLVLDFPALPARPCPPPPALIEALGTAPLEVRRARDYLALLASEEEVAALRPDVLKLAQLDCLGVIVTAEGREADFVSRFFAPAAGIPEDPVTGSAHCTLVPYWAERLGRQRFTARQLSARGGELYCELQGKRVHIGGRAVTYLTGTIEL
jgi:PhzF family phenazine biosynthesis protein